MWFRDENNSILDALTLVSFSFLILDLLIVQSFDWFNDSIYWVPDINIFKSWQLIITKNEWYFLFCFDLFSSLLILRFRDFAIVRMWEAEMIRW
jgi:hypothetical protein